MASTAAKKSTTREISGLKGALKLVNGEVGVRHVPGRAFRSHWQRAHEARQDPNVVATGICEKMVSGKRSGCLAVCFYVRHKTDPGEVRGDSFIPPVLSISERRAILTDVIEIGDPQLDAAVLGAQAQERPIQSGFSISHHQDTSGTLGALVLFNGKLHVLSNAHVLALSGRARRGDAILYPGRADGGVGANTIARLAAWSPLTGTKAAFDAAIGEVLTSSLDDVDLSILGARQPLRVIAPQRGMRIVKLGKQSGVTEGTVQDVDFSVTLPYPHLGRHVMLLNQVRCTRYSTTGDSGAIVVDKKSGAIVGMHLGSAGAASFFTPINVVLSGLSIQLA